MNITSNRRHASAIFTLLLVGVAGVSHGGPLAAPDTRDVREALKANDYALAAQLADELVANGELIDEALYLKGLAHHHRGDQPLAIEALDELLANHGESPWYRKALFLKAESFVKQRQFEEAEAILEAEAHRLLSPERKEELAGVFIRFADDLATEPDPSDVGAPSADFNKAYTFYQNALEMEIARDLRDDVLYKLASAAEGAANHPLAGQHLIEYLREFDPDWTGPVGSLERMRGTKRETPVVAGRHILDARYHLGKAELAMGQWQAARPDFEDLRTMLEAQLPTAPADKARDIEQRIANTSWQIVRSYHMPNVDAGELEKAIAQANAFLKSNRNHRHSVEASTLIAQTWHQYGRADDAIAAYNAFLNGDNYVLPAGDRATETIERLGKSAMELEAEWRPLALYQIGAIRYAQRQYEQAIEAWRRYVNQFPNGPQWATAQRQIIDAEFLIAVTEVANERYDEARSGLNQFLAANPLDHRAAQVLFILGEIEYSQEQWDRAVAEWDKLISKYPSTEEAGLALYRTGMIHEEQHGNLESALASYRRLTWSSYAGMAQTRIAVMTKKQLRLETERTFRTNEQAEVKIATRNIESLTVRQYFLDPEAYFRKTHTVGGVEALDIALIEPDKTWDVEIDGYAKYKPLEQKIGIPFEDGQPGVCIVNVAGEDWEATTLVVRSDIDFIMRASRREAIVFVQDMLTNQPVVGATLLISDGKEVFATGTSGDDGVYLASFDELESMNSLRVFATTDGGIASNALSLEGLDLSHGLSSKGYIYTERPAYQPGQMVSVRGIMRDVKDGSYIVPENAPYIIAVNDAQGRLLREEERALTEFGTFTTSFLLDPAATVGTYTITARQKERDETVYAGHFEVQQFQLQTIELAYDFEREVYFRGEIVEATLRAGYYWGAPVANRSIRYHLPDGRSFVEKTDEEGLLKVTFDTSGAMPGSILPFQATVEGEDVYAMGFVTLPQFGFNLTVATSQDLALAGEPFDIIVTTTSPNGEPVGHSINVTVLRRETIEPDPVLTNVPWVSVPRHAAAEVTVEEHEIETDAASGKATLRLTLDAGGVYVLRVGGQDRFDQSVIANASVTVSDDDDETRLRIFADSNTLKVGEQTEVRLHSRVDSGVALLTFEGETNLEYRVVNLEEGDNQIPIAVDHQHFPNFALSATMMDARMVRTASKPFEVQRELKITIKPLAATYAPGETGTVEVQVTDQLGRPVQAEIGLALVNEALLAQYPDQTPKILSFFQQGARRFVEFRLAATNGFQYAAQTQATVKAFDEEEERLTRLGKEAQQLQQAANSLSSLAVDASRPDRIATRPSAATPPPARPVLEQMQQATQEVQFGYQRGRAGASAMDDKFMSFKDSGGIAVGGGGGGLNGRKLSRQAMLGEMDADGLALGKNVEFFSMLADNEAMYGEPRRERPEAGWWDGSIVTDADGKATIHIPMPENTTRWQLVARGVTTETLVGEATAAVTTRKDFFVDLKSPAAALEGDQLRILARVHDLTEYEGLVNLELTVTSGDQTFARIRKTVDLKAGELGEVLFDSFDVPAVGALEVTISARAGDQDVNLSDAVSRSITVHPFGIQFAAHGGGVSSNSSRLLLELPRDLQYSSKWLTVSVGPDLRQQIIDMALSGIPIVRGEHQPVGTVAPSSHRSYGHSHGSELLATVAGIKYARATNSALADQTRLVERARSLISALVVSQHQDGGWTWGGSNRTDFLNSATGYWALSEAKQMGLVVNDDAMSRAQTRLNQFYQQAAAADHEQRAIVLHALSASKDADFKLANTLYRERNGLTPIALAYTALALANLERNDMATEVLGVLEARATTLNIAGRRLVSWGEQSRYHPWLNDQVETTAVALLAMMESRPTMPQVEPAAQFLMQQYGCFGFASGRSRGPGVAALAAYFQRGQFADADFDLTVFVNGNPVREIAADGDSTLVIFEVPAEALLEGENEVDFEFHGRGRYAFAATLRGFSSQFKDPNSFRGPYVRNRWYYHAPLEYRGVALSASSTSPVNNLEIGQRTRVYVDVHNNFSYNGFLVVEESLPAGMTLVPGSLTGGGFTHHEQRDGRIVMYIPQGETLRDFNYELVGYATGRYRALPTVVRDAFDPSIMRVHEPAQLTVLAPGESSGDPYIMNDGERYALGTAYFNDGLYAECLDYLWPLFDRENKYQEREVARMLLWSYTAEEHFNAERVVQAFELLSVRHPDLNIPFDRILKVGEAYRYIGEFERAWLVFRATIESSFRSDSMISAVLEDEGQLLASFDYQRGLWWEYPDLADVAASYFALAQTIYEEAPNAHRLADVSVDLSLPDRGIGEEMEEDGEITRVTMLVDAIGMLDNFLAIYPESPLRDDAAFSMTGAFLDLKDYEAVVRLSERFGSRFSDSTFASSFQYMEALGWFWQRAYEEALESARVVADGESLDRDFARYILGQIYHAEGRPGDAINWYEQVRTLYPDAAEAIEYFRKKSILLDEVSIFKPGDPVKVALDYRNVSDASLQVYKVDLMKLYLREKNLSNITEVNLAGISPQLVKSFTLGDGKDYMDKEYTADLDLSDEGAYLVICRGDNLFASGLVLITPLEIEVQEDAGSGRVRVNLVNAIVDIRPAEVHVKVVGSASGTIASGETDLRGIFVANAVNGTVTAIARDADARYAFYRGETWLGGAAAGQGQGRQLLEREESKAPAVDYNSNLRQQQMDLQEQNRAEFDAYRRSGNKGVEVQRAR